MMAAAVLAFGFPRCHELPTGRGLGTCVSHHALCAAVFSGEVDDGRSLPCCHELPTGRGLGTCVSRHALVRQQQHGVKMGPEINCKGEELIKVIKISEKESYLRLSFRRLRLIRCKISYDGGLI
jgi:hypothetical protein